MKPKNPVGRPRIIDGLQIKNVNITQATIDKAKRIGDGNLSKGVRDAVRAFKIKGDKA